MCNSLSKHTDTSARRPTRLAVLVLIALVPALLSPSRPCVAHIAPQGPASSAPVQTLPGPDTDREKEEQPHAVPEAAPSTWEFCSAAQPEAVAVSPTYGSTRISVLLGSDRPPSLDHEAPTAGGTIRLAPFTRSTPSNQERPSRPSQGSPSHLRSVVLRI